MKDLVPARDEQLGDQPAVTAAPVCLCAHEARIRFCEGVGESLLPLRLPHPRGVAAERRSPDAGETLLAGLAAETSAEGLGMPVADSRIGQCARQRILVELGIPA